MTFACCQLTVIGRGGADGATAMPLATRDNDTGTAVAPIRLHNMEDLIVREMKQKQRIATYNRVQVW